MDGYRTVYGTEHLTTIVLIQILNENPYKQLPSMGNGWEGEDRCRKVMLDLLDRYSKRGEGLASPYFQNAFSLYVYSKSLSSVPIMAAREALSTFFFLKNL